MELDTSDITRRYQVRRHQRVRTLYETVIFHGGSTTSTGAVAVDVSAGGLCLKTPVRLERGRVVWVLLRTSLRSREVAAEVVRGDPFSSYGLQFVSADRRGANLARLFAREARDRLPSPTLPA